MTVPPVTDCSPAGLLSAGMICATSDTGETSELDWDGTLDFLEARPDHAAAVCESAKDFTAKKAALEELCRELGAQCTYELRKLIRMHTHPLDRPRPLP